MLLRPVFSMLLIGALMMTAGGVSPALAAEEEAKVKPTVIAVKFHADWCGSCRAMGPVFEDLANKHDTDPVLFVHLDLTDSKSTRQAGYLMRTIGAGEVWDNVGGKTGMILLLDADSKQVMRKMTRDHSFKQMSAELVEIVEAR